ncbi:IS3 family transposase [Pectinatus brassicae]|uniref:Transposase InsO family protein n=1 Tax=Pectinatus brassicae TaxID=862415 RepID=A0A840UN44_9FIRM|nr:IS3 family transposase [Pectinatus brassicae]MBB5337630.1 transposase InsO family protein [Pectinatus brassicae]
MTEIIYREVEKKISSIEDEKTSKLEKKRHVSVSGMLYFLGVSKSGYSSWTKRNPSKQEVRKRLIQDKIMDIYHESHQNYGAPKIAKSLQSTGEFIAERTVGQYMRELGIKAQYVKPYTVTTINSNFSDDLKNILNEEFNPLSPNALWCTDITYIWTLDGFVYLTSIMDLFSRKIIFWTLSKTLEVSRVVETVKNALATRKVTPKLIHSDRGSQVRQEVA